MRESLRILDLFSGAGGAAWGIHLACKAAGVPHEIVGVDIVNQPRYPFQFRLADAMHYPLGGFDFIWASPPCQSYSSAMRHLAAPRLMLIDAMRKRLEECGTAWVIENVLGARMRNWFWLCGTQFGMRVHRHRLIESPYIFILQSPCDKTVNILNPHRAKSRDRIYREFGKQDPEKLWGKEMGVGWMNRQETREAVP